MRLEPFAMERFQSTWEHQVAWNLSESGVEPLRVEELALADDDRLALLKQPLIYTQTNGTIELRRLIAALYAGAGTSHVQVTNGGAEANLVALMRIVEPGDDIVMMLPNYMQAPGLVRGLGGGVVPWPLRMNTDSTRWEPDLAALESLVTSRTKAICICHPNNPTGCRLTAAELDAIGAIASRVGAWVISDEIYRGAELDAVESDSMWGRSDRVIVTSGLSKAYGLPGLRIGWVVAPPEIIADIWGIHDYTTIAPGAVSDLLARIALSPDGRERLLARTRGIVRANYPMIRSWLEKRKRFTHVPPEAGAIVFARYSYDIGSTALVERLRDEQSVLVVPGDHFGMDGYLRLGFGSDPEYLAGGLERVAELLDALP
ncbi:MAG TPA: aminotransferase class I/II-fold pyridoxal phosphate-dependent enzyme [Vicinamibacterales bacterium]|nr:aminotransferase class I/II-fold pyridoxal phosphate-dependent enzyme [Vicinamibacterales bacterium]